MNVLVVEDEADLRLLMRLHLERAGHRVDEAPDGAVALEYLAQHAPDLVLLDLRMPRVDGWQVLERLAQSGRLDSLPVIVVSAYADPLLMRRTIELGGRAFLNKPFGRPELLQLIADVVDAA